MAYLLSDCAGTLDELPFGEAVSGAELQGSSLLDQVDAAMAQLLHPRLNLEADLKAQTGDRLTSLHRSSHLHPSPYLCHCATQSQSCPKLARLSSSPWMKMISSTLREAMLALHL